MKAIVYEKSLPIEHINSLVIKEIPVPEINDTDVLIEVRAISINPVDVKIRVNSSPEQGEYRVLGWDASGIVRQKGNAVTGFEIGDEVYYAGDINRPGSYSEFQSVDFRLIAKKPTSLSFADAAAIPLTALTAWEGLFERLNVIPTEASNILVVGAAGGVGSMIIQLLKARTSLNIIATASREESSLWVKELGADYVISHFENMQKQIDDQKILPPKYIFSTADSDKYLSQYGALIQPQGKIVLIDDPEVFDITPLKGKSITVAWELMFTRSLYSTEDLSKQGEILKEVAVLIDKGVIKTTKLKELSAINVENLKKAHKLIESNRTVGKIVLNGWEE